MLEEAKAEASASALSDSTKPFAELCGFWPVGPLDGRVYGAHEWRRRGCEADSKKGLNWITPHFKDA